MAGTRSRGAAHGRPEPAPADGTGRCGVRSPAIAHHRGDRGTPARRPGHPLERRRSELVTDLPEETFAVGLVSLGLDPRGRQAVDDPDDASPAIGLRDEDSTEFAVAQ